MTNSTYEYVPRETRDLGIEVKEGPEAAREFLARFGTLVGPFIPVEELQLVPEGRR